MMIIFIVNNKKDRMAQVLPKLVEYCQVADVGSVLFKTTLRRKHGIQLAKEATDEGCDHLIAVGGDGTLNEVINGMFQSKRTADAYPTIGLLPYGSANDFARTAGLSKSIEALIALIRSNSTQRIDLGKIIIQESKLSRYFANIAGVGLGPEVVQSIEASSSVLGPGFKYFIHIIKGFLSYDKKEVSCTSSTWQWQGQLMQMAVANGRYYGNAICTAPDADLSDGKFQVVIFGDLSIWDYLRNFGKLKKGRRIDHPHVSYREADELLIESSASCGIEADGEYVGLVPARISILPKAISFVMPPLHSV